MVKEEVMNLWRICFQDSEEFIRFYFERKYREENTLTYVEKGKVVSALQMLPYSMNWQGKKLSVSYISGASTLPEARNKGIMHKLLNKAFLIMKSRKIALSVLIPQEAWLYDYYARSGYAPAFAYTPENYYLPVRRLHPAVKILDRADYLGMTDEIYRYFDRHLQKRANCIQHTADDFAIIADDLYLSGGRLLLSRQTPDRISGLAFAQPLPEKVKINELMYEGEEDKSALLNTAAAFWDKGEIECKTPPRSGHSARRGMARIIDAYQMLCLYAAAHPRKSLLLHLKDEGLLSNTGYYRLKNGLCFRTGSGVQRPDLKLDIGELARLVFEQPAFLSLMLD